MDEDAELSKQQEVKRKDEKEALTDDSNHLL